jgi:hypothetical protein
MAKDKKVPKIAPKKDSGEPGMKKDMPKKGSKAGC